MMRQIANFFSFIVAGLLLCLTAAVIQLWPSSFWFEVVSVRVFDAKVGESILMAVDRRINRDFSGSWIASVRRLDGGGWVSYCTATGRTNYAVDSRLPEPLTLRWWTHPECNPLPAGKYQMRTTWVIHGPNLLPDKTVQADSNIFQVNP